ncbi:MAG: helix-turn-helix transcriptional regulator [Synergistaceae bacterium]|nr:helix-turn-helix transcriptional regulator [Synergistaceae bacterium]
MVLKDGIRRYRKRMNLSMAGLGRLVGAERSTVCRWEKGESKPTVDGLIKLAEFFGVTETELLHPKAEDEENEDSKNVQ